MAIHTSLILSILCIEEAVTYFIVLLFFGNLSMSACVCAGWACCYPVCVLLSVQRAYGKSVRGSWIHATRRTTSWPQTDWARARVGSPAPIGLWTAPLTSFPPSFGSHSLFKNDRLGWELRMRNMNPISIITFRHRALNGLVWHEIPSDQLLAEDEWRPMDLLHLMPPPPPQPNPQEPKTVNSVSIVTVHH